MIDTRIEDKPPLAGAVFNNDTTIIGMLLSADADPLAGSPSALATARFFGKEELTRQLLQHIQRRLQGSEHEPSIGSIAFRAAI